MTRTCMNFIHMFKISPSKKKKNKGKNIIGLLSKLYLLRRSFHFGDRPVKSKFHQHDFYEQKSETTNSLSEVNACVVLHA